MCSKENVAGDNLYIGEASITSKLCIDELKTLMEKLTDEDRCIICRAIKELENFNTNRSFDNNWIWMMLIMILISGWGNRTSFDFESIMKTYMDAKNKADEKEE